MFRAVADGRIKAIWIMGTNPVVSMPEADLVEAALKTCPFVVVSDVVAETDTLRLAHVKLPAAAWGEKDGTVTNSERRDLAPAAFSSAAGRGAGRLGNRLRCRAALGFWRCLFLWLASRNIR